MRIKDVHIQNFRSFRDERISFGDYTCFVGCNGSGKSTVLHALNFFFQYTKDLSLSLTKPTVEDFHHRNTELPICVTVTFTDLSDEAKDVLGAYVRHEELIVSAEARLDSKSGKVEVRQYGTRMGFEDFRDFFEKDKAGVPASELGDIFNSLREKYPEIDGATSRQARIDSLRNYEEAHPEGCIPIPSEDSFYGIAKTNKLSPFVQWIFVPAVKNAAEEAEESKTSALGEILNRTVRSRINFSKKVSEIRSAAVATYDEMLESQQGTLAEISKSIEANLQTWSHPKASANLQWKNDSDRTIRIDEPIAAIQLGEGGFSGGLVRFGHGLQRSFLLALLHELSLTDSTNEPRLIMGIEEPELYQHPPQARHLSTVLRTLSGNDTQVMCCTHSPYFVPGQMVESVRLVKEAGDPSCSSVSSITYAEIAEAIKDAGGDAWTEEGITAKLYPELNPTISEIFFSAKLVLVEGLEDVSYILSEIELLGLSEQFRKQGCNIVPVGGKSSLIKPIAVARNLGIPTFVVFDGDTQTNPNRADWILSHKRDNRIIQNLLGVACINEWPEENVFGDDYCIWSEEITSMVAKDIGDEWGTCCDSAYAKYGQPGDLHKNPLAISAALDEARSRGKVSNNLRQLVETILKWAEKSE